jgi:hypothetical protein
VRVKNQEVKNAFLTREKRGGIKPMDTPKLDETPAISCAEILERAWKSVADEYFELERTSWRGTDRAKAAEPKMTALQKKLAAIEERYEAETGYEIGADKV